MPGPLSSLKVVEMGTLIAGPYCARLLAEFGAEVVKVEAPGEGDPLRKWRRLHEGTSLWWYVQARNKKSIAVNLREADGQAVVRRLEVVDSRSCRNAPDQFPGVRIDFDDLV